MAVDGLAELTARLLAEGYPPDLPGAVALDAAAPEERIVNGSLAEIAAMLPKTTAPGIVLVGEAVKRRLRCRGALDGEPTLFAGSETIADEAVGAIERWGGHPIRMPMVRLAPPKEAATFLPAIAAADWLLVSSLSCAAILLDIIAASGFDLRRPPKLAVSGKSTRNIFARHGIHDYGTEGMLRALADKAHKTDKLLWLRSDAANPATLERLKALFPSSEGVVFYHNIPLKYDSLPDFDSALFTSPSSAKAFVDNFSAAALDGKTVCVIGAPTEAAVKALGAKAEILKPSEASLEGMLAALAAKTVNASLKQMETT